MALYLMKDVWNCATIMNGVQSVMMLGVQLMLELHVGRLGSLNQVISLKLFSFSLLQFQRV